MIKLVIYCVNYNSKDKLMSFLSSINKAKAFNIKVVVYISNNSGELNVDCKSFNFEINIRNNVNMGYYGGITSLLLNGQESGWKIFSNVDIIFEEEFWPEFVNSTRLKDFSRSVIAPSIIDHASGIDRNPKLITRYSKTKLILLKWLYKSNLFYFYELFSGLKTNLLAYFGQNDIKRQIYCPHGSCIIFGSDLELSTFLPFPSFLFGEELWISEICRKNRVDVLYSPSLRISDSNHASTGSVNRRKLNRWNAQSCDLILNTFYNE
jgi:hypothetical protein